MSDLDGLLPKPGYNKSLGLSDLVCPLDPRLRGDDTASLRQESTGIPPKLVPAKAGSGNLVRVFILIRLYFIHNWV